MERMKKNINVFVALSGGVDSAVAAAQLIAEGYQVTGIHMDTWKDPKGLEADSEEPDSLTLARQTADLLGIQFVSLDLRAQFYDQVVRSFIHDYLEGKTPNPCLFCNPQIKWGILQNYALNHGADFFATGHYARIEHLESGKVRLLKGLDKNKDQSYVLSMLGQRQLSKSLLPLGEFMKEDVKIEARRRGLFFVDREESQDLCFLGRGDYRDFLSRYAPQATNPGKIINQQGKVIGEHEGLAFYTIGQRKGIRVAAPEPYYVTQKDHEKNQLIVGFAEGTFQSTLTANRVNWIASIPPRAGNTYSVMIRYRAKPVLAKLSSISNAEFRLKFIDEVRGITPGQVAVLYQGEECLGGGIIQTFS